jgi:hypothetical protein
MNWLRNIFRKLAGDEKLVADMSNTVTVQANLIAKLSRHNIAPHIPTKQPWGPQDRAALEQFLMTVAGRKLIGNMAHRIYEFHLDACTSSVDAAVKNSYVRAANDNLSMVLYLASEDSHPQIFSRSPLAKGENITAPDVSESGPLNLRT